MLSSWNMSIFMNLATAFLTAWISESLTVTITLLFISFSASTFMEVIS